MGTSPAWAGGTLPPHPGRMVTRSGVWTYRDADNHHCDKPNYNPTVEVGDRWKCNTCQTEWRVTKIDGDQRETWLVWEEYESWKSGPFPPGTK